MKDENKKTAKSGIVSSAMADASNDTVQCYGSGVRAHVVGYTGTDSE